MTVTVPPDHIHISEREADGTWEDCTWDSGLEWYRLCYDARKPATHAEAQLLRRASGEPATGGSNMTDFARGVKARYGTTIPARISGFASLKAALTPGKAAVIQGSMSSFGPDHRLSKYDRNFDGAHAVVLMNIDGTLLWCDPEAPTLAAVPVIVTWFEVQRFVAAFSGQHVVGSIKNLAPKEDTMPSLTTYTPGYKATVKPTANIRSAPTLTAPVLQVVNVTPDIWTIIGTVKGAVDPDGGSDQWYVRWNATRYEYTAKSNVTSVAAPAVDDGYTKATQDAAVAAATASATTAATKAERERIALAEANRIRTI